MALTKQEVKELAELISVIEVSDVFGVGDLARRRQLEGKATDENLRKACKIAKVNWRDIYDLD